MALRGGRRNERGAPEALDERLSPERLADVLGIIRSVDPASETTGSDPASETTESAESEVAELTEGDSEHTVVAQPYLDPPTDPVTDPFHGSQPVVALFVEEHPGEQQQPADGVPVDERPADGVPVDEQPADGVPVDEQPADGVPVDELPVDEVLVEELPGEQEQLVDELPTDSPSVVVKPAGEHIGRHRRPTSRKFAIRRFALTSRSRVP